MTNSISKESTTNTGLIKRNKKAFALKPVSGQTPTIDYPQEGEQIREGSYTIRVSAEPGSEVEISINNGEWRPCRSSIGYWWFDWQALGSARCKLVAHSRIGKDRWKKSDARSCQIVNSNPPLNVGMTFD